MDQTRAAGRPEIGNAIHVRLGSLASAVDDWAGEHGFNRAEAVRRLVSSGLDIWPQAAFRLPDDFEVIDRAGDVEAGVQVESDGKSYAITVLETGEVKGITGDPLVAAAIEAAALLGYKDVAISDVRELHEDEVDAWAYPELVERGQEILANLEKRAAELRSQAPAAG